MNTPIHSLLFTAFLLFFSGMIMISKEYYTKISYNNTAQIIRQTPKIIAKVLIICCFLTLALQASNIKNCYRSFFLLTSYLQTQYGYYTRFFSHNQPYLRLTATESIYTMVSVSLAIDNHFWLRQVLLSPFMSELNAGLCMSIATNIRPCRL